MYRAKLQRPMNERAYTRGNGINRGDINQTG